MPWLNSGVNVSKLIFDIETDGLYEDVTRCWVICIKDVGRGSVVERYWGEVEGGSFPEDLPRSGSIRDALDKLSEAGQIIGHNIIGYDIPALKKLYGFEPKGKVTDTLVLSRLFQPDRAGGHSLAAWGERLGFPKGDYHDWTNLNKEMVEYCEQDVNVTAKLYEALKKEIHGQKWGESIELEHSIATIMAQQEINGVYFDTEKARGLLDQLGRMVRDIDDSLSHLLPTTAVPKGAFVSAPYTKTGKLSVRASKAVGEGAVVIGPFQTYEYNTVDLNSTHQVKRWLMENHGWVPTELTPTGGAKLTEDSFGSLTDESLGKMLSDRITYKHRMGQIQGWVDNVRDDHRITAGANTIGTPTGRMRHSKVVNVPAVGAFYGEEMRSLFCAPDEYAFVGHDASGLELRMLAHYMNDPEYTEILLNGDIHSHNQELAGLHTRSSAKTFIYAFIYGAGNAKLGSIIEGGEDEGAALRARFLRENPKLNKLINKAKRAARERGYLIGLDGRHILMRRDERGRVMEHKALNTLLQCAGAVVMKKSMELLNKWATEEQLVFKKVIDMHDEGQAEVWAPHAKRYAELAEESVREAGRYFNLNVPLDAEAKIGKNWAETH